MRRLSALALTVVAAVALIARLPTAIRALDDQATYNAQRGSAGRLLVAADSINVDNDFVLATLSVLPLDAKYAVLLPPSAEVAASSYGIGALTLSALPGYMQFMLLPRRQVAPDQAQYVLCYACDTSPWDHRTTWIWKNSHAVLIGKVNGA
jgi:hypothetical protein